MANSVSSLLDQLMGPNRNKIFNENESQIKTKWDDSDVCPYYLCGFCPHDLFKNTREDLGPCQKIHNDTLRLEFQSQRRSTQNRYKTRYLAYLTSMMTKGEARVSRAKERLELEAPQGSYADPILIRQAKEIGEMKAEIQSLDRRCEKLGEEGKVREAQEALQKQEQLKGALVRLKEQEKLQRERSAIENQTRQLYVCEVCGGFIVSEKTNIGQGNDPNGSKRMIAHQAGRMHVGYTKIKEMVIKLREELKGASIEQNIRGNREMRRRKRTITCEIKENRKSRSCVRQRTRRRRS